MAPFNPGFQTPQDDSTQYLRFNRPISPYEGDKSTGVALAGLGSLFKDAVSSADEVIKSYIDDGLRKDVEGLRQQQTGALEQIAGVRDDLRVGAAPSDEVPFIKGPAGQPTPDVSSSTDRVAPPNIIPGATAAPIPEGLQSVDKTMTSIKNGALTRPDLDTYYEGLLTKKLQDWRSRWSGYADYIDQRGQAIIGYNPANKYMVDLMSFIKENGTNVEKDRRQAITDAIKSPHLMGSDGFIMKVQTPGTWEYKNPLLALAIYEQPMKDAHTKLVIQDQKNTSAELTNKVDIMQNKQTANDAAEKIDVGKWNNTMRLTNSSDEELAKDGIAPMSTLDAQAKAARIRQMGISVQTEIENTLNKSGVGKIIGSEEVHKIAMTRREKYDAMADAYFAGKTDVGSQLARTINAVNQSDTAWLMQQKDIGPSVRMSMALASGGPAMAGMTARIAERQVKDKAISLGMDAFIQYNKLQVQDGVWGPNNINSQHQSYGDVIDSLRSKGVGDTNVRGPTAVGERQVYDVFTKEIPSWIADPTIPDEKRKIIATNVFTGQVPIKFDNDTYDNNGKLIPGRHTVFKDMTNTPIRESVWNLSGGGRDPLWLQYKNWSWDQASSLLTGDVKNLNGLAANPNLEFTWNTDTAELGIRFKPGFNQSPYGNAANVTAALAKNYTKAVQDINDSLHPMIGIAQREGTNPNAAVLTHLNSMGFNINGIDNISQVMKTIVGPNPFPDGKPEAPASKAKGKKSEAPEALPDIFNVAPTASQMPAGALGFAEGTGLATTEDLAAKRTPTIQMPKGVDTGVIDRARFVEELNQKPWLKNKIMGIAAGENLHPKANLAVIESMMNRAEVRGTSLEEAAKLYGREKGGYYAGYKPGELRNPKVRGLIEGNLQAALQGSNVSNYATDNSSGDLAIRDERLARFERRSDFGGKTRFGKETFFAPLKYGRKEYDAWLSKVQSTNVAGGGA